mgnify:FL=1
MKLLILTSFVFSFLISPSWGAEAPTVYKCDFGTGVGFFRVKKNNKKPLISIRKNLDWVRWCSEEYHTLKMYDEGGICHIKYHKIDENTWINDQTVILDLLLRTVVNVNNLGEKSTFRCSIFK